MQNRALGRSGLTIPPLVVGGNVFGWTVDEALGFRLLDALHERGLTAIDTADVYSVWAPGNNGGESETIIGNWLAANPGKRAAMTIFTKVGSDMREPGHKGLSARWIAQGVEDSLRRLKTDVIDLYFAHRPDPETPIEETLEAFGKLIAAGKVRAIGGSNLSVEQLQTAVDAAASLGLPRYEALQNEYNLYDRGGFEGPMADFCVSRAIGTTPYYALASGFLTGKYRSQADLVAGRRGRQVEAYLNPRGLRILDALNAVAQGHAATPATVALAWLIQKCGVTAPIASATSLEQVESVARACALVLTEADMDTLDHASAG